MSREQLDGLLSEIRAARSESLAYLTQVPEEDFSVPTDLPRWDEVRRVLLRLGEHMMEHVNQLEGARSDIGRHRTMPQRMLSEAEQVYGRLLASTVGLEDADLDTEPGREQWTIRTVLEHILSSERSYLSAVKEARARAGRN